MGLLGISRVPGLWSRVRPLEDVFSGAVVTPHLAELGRQRRHRRGDGSGVRHAVEEEASSPAT